MIYLNVLFAEIPGHIELKNAFTRAIREGRVSHAQLFHGPGGSAALPLALAYAQYILCKNRSETDACGQCPSCIKVKQLAHPDLHFSFPTLAKDKEDSASSDNVGMWRKAVQENPFMDLRYWASQLEDENKIPIIHVREASSILSRLALKSYEGGYKILLMWLPESMNTETANKLLKILEEPPEQTLFLLVSFQPEMLLPTIISRVQLTKIPAWKEEEIAAYLMKHFSLEEQDATDVAMLADGSMMEAWRQMEYREEGDTYLEMFKDWMRKCFKFSPIDLFDLAQTFAGFGKVRQRAFLQFSMRMFRESIMMGYTSGELNRVTEEEGSFLENFGKYIGGNNIAELLEETDKTIYHLERNANPKLAFVALSITVRGLLKLPYPKEMSEA